MGKHSWIGIGAAVTQGISIGNDVTVGAGAAVIDNLADGVTPDSQSITAETTSVS